MATLEPLMFTPAAASGRPSIPADQGNQFFTQVITQMGAVTDAAVSPAVTEPTGLFAISIPIPDAATTTYNYVVSSKVEIVDVVVRKSTAGAGNTIQILNNVTAMSDAIAAAVLNAVTRAGTLDPAQTTVQAGGTIGVTSTRAAGSALANVTLIMRRR